MGIRNLLFNKFKFPTKDKVDPRIVEKQANIDIIIRDAHAKGRYCFFENSFAFEFLDRCAKENDYERFEMFYNMIKSWDDVCTLSLETGQYVSNLWLSDLNKLPAIHRTHLYDYSNEDGIPYCDDLHSIMSDGLVNYGHANLGAPQDIPALSLTTTPLDNFTGMLNLIGSYKNNNTTVILQFPREYVGEDLQFRNDQAADVIYDRSSGFCVIKPEYILGAIVKSDNDFDQFYSKEQLLSVDKNRIMK